QLQHRRVQRGRKWVAVAGQPLPKSASTGATPPVSRDDPTGSVMVIAKLVVAAVLLVGAMGPCCAQAESEGLTKDTSPPPVKNLYEDDLRLRDDAGKFFLPDDAF